MMKVTNVLLFSILSVASSFAQITWQGSQPGLSISQQIGSGIRYVPIPPPWYFLKNKYYWPTNTGLTSTTEANRFVNNNLYGQVTNGYSTPDLISKFNTVNPFPTTTKIEYEPSTTRRPKYLIPNGLGSLTASPVIPSTERFPSTTVYIPTYQPPFSTIAPSTTANSVSTIQSTYPSLTNELPFGSDPTLPNGHSKPSYTSDYPNNVSEVTTEILDPLNNNNGLTSGSPLQTSTIKTEVLAEDEKDLENEKATETTQLPLTNDNSLYFTTGPDPLNYTNSGTANKEDVRRNATNDTQSQNINPGLLFSGPQICKKQNAYFGVGENHSFYVECQDYLPSVKLCPENYSYDSNVQWPVYPCKIDNQTQIQ